MFLPSLILTAEFWDEYNFARFVDCVAFISDVDMSSNTDADKLVQEPVGADSNEESGDEVSSPDGSPGKMHSNNSGNLSSITNDNIFVTLKISVTWKFCQALKSIKASSGIK